MKLLLVAALLFSGIAHAGSWSYDERLDKMTGKKNRTASIVSDNSLRLDFPYQGTNKGYLTVRQHPQYGLDVIVQIDKGQILCRSYGNPCSFKVKFDGDQPITMGGLESADNDSTVMFFSNAKRFIERARKANTILVQLPLYQGGEQVLEFTAPAPLEWK